MEKFKENACRFEAGERSEYLISVSPIEEKKKPVTLKIIADKLSEEAGPTTLS